MAPQASFQKAGSQRVSALPLQVPAARCLAVVLLMGLTALSDQALAGILYTDPEPDPLVFNDGFSDLTYALDLDQNGVADFLLFANEAPDPPFFAVTVQPLGATGHAVAGPTGFDGCCEPFGDPLALNIPAGGIINAALSWNEQLADLACDACGNWPVGSTGYLGLRLGTGLAARYGWVRISLLGGAEARVLEFGLETVPGLLIRAGDAGICTVPVNRKGESLDEQSASLSWTPSSGALAYEVGYRLAAGGPLTRVLTPSPSLDLAGLSANTLYSWAVRSLCAADSTAFSAGLIFGTSDLPRVSSSTTITPISPGFPPSEPDGLVAFGGLGAALAALGDLNGDGLDEWVSATTFLPSGAIGGLRVVFSGGADSLLQVVNPLVGPVDIDHLCALGDLDGNGAADLAVTDDLTDQVWILRMNPDATAIAQPLLWLDLPVTGGALAGPGDFNGDAVPDLIVRSGSGAYLYRLNAAGEALSRVFLDLAAAGVGGLDLEGVAALGDLNGDGVTDLAFGDGLDADDASAAGAVYVVRLNPDASILGVSKLNGTQSGEWLRLDGSDLFGRSLTAPGDLNGDGIPDLVVSAQQDEDPLTLAGSVWVIALQADGTLLSSRKFADGQNGLSLGLQTDDRFGQGLAWISDSDGDGLPELLVGAPRADVPSSNMGAVHRLNLDAPAPCLPPADATVDSVLSTAVLLNWSAVPEATAYEIEGRRLGGAPQNALRTGTSFVRFGLIPNRSYAWRIRSQCDDRLSPWTPLDTFTTPANRLGQMDGPGALILFPNPSWQSVTLLLPELALQQPLFIWNAAGGLQSRQGPVSSLQLSLDVRGWVPGVYWVQAGPYRAPLLVAPTE